jgi:hypothetical protein
VALASDKHGFWLFGLSSSHTTREDRLALLQRLSNAKSQTHTAPVAQPLIVVR